MGLQCFKLTIDCTHQWILQNWINSVLFAFVGLFKQLRQFGGCHCVLGRGRRTLTETAFSAPFLTVSRKAPCSHSRQTDVSMSIACRRPWAVTINLCAEPPTGSRYGERLNLEPTHRYRQIASWVNLWDIFQVPVLDPYLRKDGQQQLGANFNFTIFIVGWFLCSSN
jgi:hypothetical protein